MTETGRDLVERLRQRGEAAVTPGLGYGTIVSIRGAELLALVAVVEAAQDFSDAERAMYVALVEAYNGEGDRRRVCHDAEDAALAKLREKLAALHSQASDEGKAQ